MGMKNTVDECDDQVSCAVSAPPRVAELGMEEELDALRSVLKAARSRVKVLIVFASSGSRITVQDLMALGSILQEGVSYD